MAGYMRLTSLGNIMKLDDLCTNADTTRSPSCVLQKCGYELQESKMLSLSTRHHDYGRQSRDDSQGYYSAFRGGGYEADAGAQGSGYGEGAQSGLGMFDRMNLGSDISEGDEDEESEEESSDDE